MILGVVHQINYNFHLDNLDIGINGFNTGITALIYTVPSVIGLYFGMFLGSKNRICQCQSSNEKAYMEIEVEMNAAGLTFEGFVGVPGTNENDEINVHN